MHKINKLNHLNNNFFYRWRQHENVQNNFPLLFFNKTSSVVWFAFCEIRDFFAEFFTPCGNWDKHKMVLVQDLWQNQARFVFIGIVGKRPTSTVEKRCLNSVKTHSKQAYHLFEIVRLVFIHLIILSVNQIYTCLLSTHFSIMPVFPHSMMTILTHLDLAAITHVLG